MAISERTIDAASSSPALAAPERRLLRPVALPAALAAWVVFGSYTLFRPNRGESLAIDPAVGHVVVFFFVSLAGFGVLLRWRRPAAAMLVGVISVLGVAAVSEVLQPILTTTRRAERADLAANALGIVAAVGVTTVLLLVLRRRRWRELTTVAICVLGLAGSASAIALGADRLELLRTCRSAGLDPITTAAGEPVILIDEDEFQLGGSGPPRPLGDGLVDDSSADLRCSVMRSGGYTVVATVVPDSVSTGGPMRIFTSSEGTTFDQYNTHVGQEFDRLSIRIRSGGERQWESVPDVFTAGERVTVAVVVDLADGVAVAVVDGQSRDEFELEGGTFAEWDPDFPLLIGDEFTRDRTFEGTIERVAVFDRPLDVIDDIELFTP